MSRGDPAGAFEEVRPHLFGIAYRMVGSAADAEDLVQDAALRWLGIEDNAQIASPRAYLTTIVTRLCINHLKQARAKREEYVGPWLPEPLLTDTGPTPSDRVELEESLTFAFLLLLQSLSPRQRAVFILREVFRTPTSEVADILGTSEANCRQILTRARRRPYRRGRTGPSGPPPRLRCRARGQVYPRRTGAPGPPGGGPHTEGGQRRPRHRCLP